MCSKPTQIEEKIPPAFSPSFKLQKGTVFVGFQLGFPSCPNSSSCLELLKSAPLSLGHFVELIIRFRIFKYFASCSLDPIDCLLRPWRRLLIVPAILCGDVIDCSGYFMWRRLLIVPAICGDGY
ncbi:hypothetical protein AAC387_Pa04g1394 [Persea americana]